MLRVFELDVRTAYSISEDSSMQLVNDISFLDFFSFVVG